jgi:hypothetical protein
VDGAAVSGYFSHAETSYYAIWIGLTDVLKRLLVFSYAKGWHNDFIAYMQIVDICPIEVCIWLWHIE